MLVSQAIIWANTYVSSIHEIENAVSKMVVVLRILNILI